VGRVSDTQEIPDADWSVPPELDGAHLDRVVRAKFSSFSWNQVRGWIRGGNVFLGEMRMIDPTAPTKVGAKVSVCAKPSLRKKAPEPTTRAKATKLIVHVDSQVVVVEKPAGISTVPYDENERDTLDKRVQKQLAEHSGRARLQVVHRIDKETTGLLVFARTSDALQRLKSQFRFHTVERRYLAIVQGHPRSGTITSMLVQDRGDGLRGSTTLKGLGRQATTHIQVIEQLNDACLVACTLETGRTHQIRIHLSEAGHPLLGDRVYSKGFRGELLPAPRVMLHAATLGFSHPTGERAMRFESPLPADFEQRLSELRR
jgi:23S rRNA pseudouridine1911/1915/1917 synthase